MEAKLVDFWKLQPYDNGTKCFVLYCGKFGTYFCRVKIGEMEFRMVLCTDDFKEFQKLAEVGA